MIAPTSFFSDTGSHVRILEEARILQEVGHKVTICTYHMGNEVEGVTVKRSLDVPWKQGAQVGSSRHKLYFDAVLGIKALLVALKEKPDIIHGHIHEGALIGWLLKWLRFGKTPLVFDYQGSMTSEMVDHHFLKPEGKFFKPAYKVEKLINKVADAIITSTYNSARILKEEFGVKPEKIVTVTDRVNSNNFHPYNSLEEKAETARLKAELGIPAERKVVIYLGVLAPYQGTDILLQAAAMLKADPSNLHFVIMGYPGVDSYRELANYMGLGDRVTFTGRIPYHDAPRYLALGDIAVSPKMSKTEGAGKIGNYMAMGLPTVAFETPVSREIMGDLGIYAKLGDAPSLASCIKRLADDNDLRKYLSQSLRLKALTELSWNQARMELEDLYDYLLGRKPYAVIEQKNNVLNNNPLEVDPILLGIKRDK